MANVWDAMKRHEAEAAVPVRTGPEQGPRGDQQGQESWEAPGRGEADRAGDIVEADEKANMSPALVAYFDRGGQVTEQYRALRTNLLAASPDERFCLLVTSAVAGEGKTVTCGNLAMVMAERLDRRTVLVDCDLRKRTLAKLFRIDSSPGVVELLRGKASLKQVVRPTCYPNLSLIASGRTKLREVGELVGRAEIPEIVDALRREYDYVILDTPPINMFSDTAVLGRAAGQSLLVVRMNKTPKESVDKAIRLLHAANIDLSGLVLTHRKFYIPNYLYRYS